MAVVTPNVARDMACAVNPDKRCVAEKCMAWQPYFTTRPQTKILRDSPWPLARDVPTDKGFCGWIR